MEVTDQVMSGVRVTLPASQLTEVQRERGERHTNQQKKNGKNKGLKQTAPQNKTFLNKDTNTYQHKRKQGESETKTVCYRT